MLLFSRVVRVCLLTEKQVHQLLCCVVLVAAVLQPALASVVRQLVRVHETVLELNGGQGEPLDLQRLMLGNHQLTQKQEQMLNYPTPMVVD